MRRRRYQSGSLKKRCGKWVGQWWEENQRRNRVLGPVSTMTKSDAKAALNQILAAFRTSQADVDGNMSLSQFIGRAYYPFYTRRWKTMTPMSARSRRPISVPVSIESRSCRASSAERREVFPRLMEYFGPRTELAGFAGRIPPVTR